MDLDIRLNELSHSLDYLLAIRYSSYSFFLLVQYVCAICLSPTRFVSECPATHRFLEYMYKQANQDQTQMTYRLGNNPYFNAYNSDWGAQPKFLWKPQLVVIPITQGPTFMDASYCNMPYPQHQSSPTNYDLIFKERFQQELDRIELLENATISYV